MMQVWEQPYLTLRTTQEHAYERFGFAAVLVALLSIEADPAFIE